MTRDLVPTKCLRVLRDCVPHNLGFTFVGGSPARRNGRGQAYNLDPNHGGRLS